MSSPTAARTSPWDVARGNVAAGAHQIASSPAGCSQEQSLGERGSLSEGQRARHARHGGVRRSSERGGERPGKCDTNRASVTGAGDPSL
jgi:hypothetical protein